ncbi:DUF2058 family protein [Solilutibacter silvestris]|uniref:Nucleoprotein/polynucleotide-associated enzyme n=1 Tax=Solilutibacter silvestris TaxID=1645665 RepID=A0A2K1PYN1_9GAMM|nr:DUF2058 family protein [Lysobacter silvestris]PNS07902.1 hypothetical protein Lysil_2078 [Lysobacter silvestris]
MTDTLRDQLLGLGFKPVPKPAKPPARPAAAPAKGKPAHAVRKDGKGNSPPPHKRKAPPSGGMDLGKAYAMRAEHEKAERIEAERLRQEEARLRREARERLAVFLADKALNAEDADIARHFEYGGKIKRIYVTADQLVRLNAGELGVVQLNGRYLLVDTGVLVEAERIFAQAVAFKVDPDALAADDPYADPQFQVPDDLVW